MRQHFLNGRFGSAVTAYSCHGYVLCRLYSAWAEEMSLFSFSPLPPSVRVSLRLKNLPFTFTKLKDLAALWLSDNQVSAHEYAAQTHTQLLCQHPHQIIRHWLETGYLLVDSTGGFVFYFSFWLNFCTFKSVSKSVFVMRMQTVLLDKTEIIHTTVRYSCIN